MTGSKELEPLEIHFGDTFEVAEGYFPQVPRIVIGLEDNRSCMTAMVAFSEIGEEYLIRGGIGTSGREHIGKITGRWDIDRILSAAERGYIEFFFCMGKDRNLWEDQWLRRQGELMIESQKPPVFLLP